MKRTVFVSSTYQDLANHRKAVWGLLEGFDASVRGMEEFGARTETPLETCIVEVEQSDVYIGIIGFRLGSVEESSGKSFTQLEYERAQDLAKETLIYLIDEENALVPVKFIDRDLNREKLEAFKRKLRERHTIVTFVSEDDLVEKLRRDLRRYLDPSSSNSPAADEFSQAAAEIRKFLLVPKLVAGREVRLEIQVTGEPYPASRELCVAFNYEFGATVGVPLVIVRPEDVADSGLSELYLSAKQVDDFLPVSKDEHRHIYAKLQFASAAIEKVRTRFKDESYFAMPAMSAMSLASNSAFQSIGETIHRPAEAKVILALTKIAQ